MGGAIYQNLLRIKSWRLAIFDVNDEKILALKAKRDFVSLDQLVMKSDVIILAVKPQSLAKLAEGISSIKKGTLVISILAGIKIQKISELLLSKQVIRAMPNLAVKVGSGTTVWVANKSVTKTNHSIAKKIFSILGVELEVKQENKLDVVTALSGSGPAYYYYFSELLQKAAVGLGLSKSEAEFLAMNTFLGSADLFAKSGQKFEQLRKAVTSAKGTTAAAIQSFDDNHMALVVSTALKSAHTRAEELSRKI